MAEGSDGAVPPFAPRIQVVDPEVSRAKLKRELEDWGTQEALYRQRGLIITTAGDLTVEIIVLARLTNLPVVIATASVRLDFTNYDLEPPSVVFIDPFTREMSPPLAQAYGVEENKGAVPLIIQHPDLNRPFLCQPGIWEYHVHMEHTDDPFVGEHRDVGRGRLATIAERLWQTTCHAALHAQVGFNVGPDMESLFAASGLSLAEVLSPNPAP